MVVSVPGRDRSLCPLDKAEAVQDMVQAWKTLSGGIFRDGWVFDKEREGK
jgi:hypothetical protein